MQTAEIYASFFQKSNFRTVIDKSKSGLTDTIANAAHDCSDGRDLLATIYEFMVLGPHTLGATPGLANYIALASTLTFSTKLKHVYDAVDRVKKAGYEGGWHDISEHHPLHCGQQGLMDSAKIKSLPKQLYSPLQAAEIVASKGGISLDRGDTTHRENEIIFNLIPDSTRIPNGFDQKFVFDKWFLDEVGVNLPPKVLVATIVETISLLSPVRNVRIMTEG